MKNGKYSHFANFVHICIFSRVTLQGYIFRILPHFATKLCNSTNFEMLFLIVVKNFVLPPVSLSYTRS